MIKLGVGQKINFIPGIGLHIIVPRGGAAIPWWLSGGISAADVAGVWQFKGAASLDASYLRLDGDQGYADIDPTVVGGIAPTWDVTNGAIFNGSNQYLNTGILINADRTSSVLVRFSNVSGGGGRWILGYSVPVSEFFGIQPIDDQTPSHVAYYHGTTAGDHRFGTGLASGVLAICAGTAYRNGAVDGTIGGSLTAPKISIYLGAIHIGASALAHRSCYMQAVAFYKATINGPQAAAVSAAMAAL